MAGAPNCDRSLSIQAQATQHEYVIPPKLIGTPVPADIWKRFEFICDFRNCLKDSFGLVKMGGVLSGTAMLTVDTTEVSNISKKPARLRLVSIKVNFIPLTRSTLSLSGDFVVSSRSAEGNCGASTTFSPEVEEPECEASASVFMVAVILHSLSIVPSKLK